MTQWAADWWAVTRGHLFGIVFITLPLLGVILLLALLPTSRRKQRPHDDPQDSP